MSKNGQRVHTDGNTLQNSPMDLVELSKELHTRFVELTELFARVNHREMMIPESMQRAFTLWRTMHARHKAAMDKIQTSRDYPSTIADLNSLFIWMVQQGAFKHTLDERKAVQEVAQWTVDQNCILRNQPIKKLEFDW